MGNTDGKGYPSWQVHLLIVLPVWFGAGSVGCTHAGVEFDVVASLYLLDRQLIDHQIFLGEQVPTFWGNRFICAGEIEGRDTGLVVWGLIFRSIKDHKYYYYLYIYIYIGGNHKGICSDFSISIYAIYANILCIVSFYYYIHTMWDLLNWSIRLFDNWAN